MQDECYVMLLYDEDGTPSVLVSDAPDAPCTVGAQKLRAFVMTDGWPEEAREYANELSVAHSNAPIGFEWWAMRDFGEDVD